MDNSDSKLIATIEAVSQAARISWSQPHDQDRRPPAPSHDEVRDTSSRETTPAIQYLEPEIQLTFDKMPKNPKNGWVFGSDKRECDGWLGERDQGFSSRLFSISLADRGGLIFKDLWDGQTTVKYGDKNTSPRNGFTWMLFKNWKIEISMKRGKFEFKFKIKWPDREERGQGQAECEALVESYLQEHQDAMLAASDRSRWAYLFTGQEDWKRYFRDGLQSHRCEHRSQVCCKNT